MAFASLLLQSHFSKVGLRYKDSSILPITKQVFHLKPSSGRTMASVFFIENSFSFLYHLSFPKDTTLL